jgi:hypothetical protein
MILQAHLLEIFDLFKSKAPTWSPDSYPEFILDIISNLARKSNSKLIPLNMPTNFFCYSTVEQKNVFSCLVLGPIVHPCSIF